MFVLLKYPSRQFLTAVKKGLPVSWDSSPPSPVGCAAAAWTASFLRWTMEPPGKDEPGGVGPVWSMPTIT